jgi:hypothetical protein
MTESIVEEVNAIATGAAGEGRCTSRCSPAFRTSLL